jgi:hypothetical protein
MTVPFACEEPDSQELKARVTHLNVANDTVERLLTFDLNLVHSVVLGSTKEHTLKWLEIHCGVKSFSSVILYPEVSSS